MANPFNVSIDKATSVVTISGEIVIENEAFGQALRRLSDDRHPLQMELVMKALRLGMVALSVDSNSIFITQMEAEIGRRMTELRLVEMNREVVPEASDKKGKKAEKSIVEVLEIISNRFGLKDKIEPSGTDSASGAIERIGGDAAQLGDAVVHIDGTDLRIAVESKMQKSVVSSDFVGTKTLKTALDVDQPFMQSLGAQANRRAGWTIFVSPVDGQLAKKMPGFNFQLDHNARAVFCVVDQSIDDFDSLVPAYLIARALTLAEDLPAIQETHLRTIAKLLHATVSDVVSRFDRIEKVRGSAQIILDEIVALQANFDQELEDLASATSYIEEVLNATHTTDSLKLKVRQINELSKRVPAAKALKVKVKKSPE